MTFSTLIDAPSLRGLLGKPGVAVIDCRFDLANPAAGRDAYLAGHIPGALYADLNHDLSGPITPNSGRHPLPSPQALGATLERFGIGPDTQVIAYDDSAGAYAARAWWLLRWVRHRAVAVLDGGLKAWLAMGGILEAGAAAAIGAATAVGTASAVGTAAPASLTSRPDESAVLESGDVESLLEDRAFLLIDARAAERFAGTIEPIDPVAGHVAGAVNQPFSANLGSDGRFLPPAALRQLWQKRLGGRDPKNVAAMCGSGVTACHNLLSMEVAGLHGAKLYAGSWSEWIRDPKRPTAQGM
jgi:thiosulfate/3-mercaptopyruvate sulfurtransferase